MSTPRHHRARVGGLTSRRAPDDPELIAARRDLVEANLAARIERDVAGWPPLTPEQRDRLALLLRGGS